MSLERLLHPHTVDRFYSEIWEARHLHVTGAENPGLRSFVDALVTVDGIDRLLTTAYGNRPGRWNAVRMGQDGVVIAPERYQSNGNGVTAEVDVDRVLALHRNGASIILNSVQEVLEPVGELCRSLTAAMGVHVHANIYLTPAEAQGFPKHFDAHDVFLLQIAGRKHWRLARSPVPLAIDEAQGPEELEPQGPTTELLLAPGELLYIPRGVLHEGVTSTEMSAHLTIGMNPFTWGHLLHELVRELERTDVELRRSVPTRSPSPPDLGAVLASLTAKLTGDRMLARRTVQRIVRERSDQDPPRLRGVLTRMYELDDVTLDAPVRRRTTTPPDLCVEGDELRLTLDGTTVTLPAYTRPQVEALCAGAPIRARDLPPGLDDAGRLVLVRRLVRDGVLETTHPAIEAPAPETAGTATGPSALAPDEVAASFG